MTAASEAQAGAAQAGGPPAGAARAGQARVGAGRAGEEPAREEVLAVEGVSVTLGGRRVLDEVSFTLGAGELTGLIGSNGAGKTTLFRVLLGLQHPVSGRVRLNGRPRVRRNPSIGYVPQKINLDPDMPLRARDLVGLGLDGHRLGIPLPSRSRRRAVDEMLEAVDASRFADARVGTLSGGEQQRVMIAHALISRPRLMLLDEPLANLDIRSGQEVVSLLSGICRRQGIAVLISAHEMNPLLPVMDRIVYLAGGRAATGTTEEVVTSATLTALYGHPVEVLRVRGRILVVSDLEDHDAGPDAAGPDATAGPGATAGPDAAAAGPDAAAAGPDATAAGPDATAGPR